MAVYDDEEGVERDGSGRIAIPKGHDYAEDNATNRALDRQADETRRHGRDNINNAYSNWGKKPDDGENKSAKKTDGSSGDKKSSNDKKPDSSESLKNKEESAPDRSGFSAGDDMRERLGLGYTGKGSNKSKTYSKLYNNKSDSALKKKIAIAGALAGLGTITSIIIFLALLPLKIEHIISSIEMKAGAAAMDATDKAAGNLFSSWVAKEVLPNLNKGACHSTRDATCVSTAKGDSPVSKLYNGWKQGRLETKLASKYGIVIGKQGNNFYMNIDGQIMPNSNKALTDLMNDPTKHSIFDVANSTGDGRASRSEVRAVIRDALKDATKYDKVVFRYKIGKLLETKYGLKRCLIACDTRDKFSDTRENVAVAGKAFFYRNLTPQKYGLMMQCVMDPNVCTGDLEPAANGDNNRETEFQKKLKQQLLSYRSEFGKEKLDALVKKADAVGKDGLFGYAIRSGAEWIAGKVSSEASKEVASKATGELAARSVPVLGWVIFGSAIIAGASTIGLAVQHAGYAINSATAAQTYGTAATAIAEVKSGHGDLAVLGSVSEIYSTNMSGAATDRVDMSASPLFQQVTTGTRDGGFASILGSILPGTVSAEEKVYTATGCPIPADKVVCDNERLDQGNEAATAISQFTNDYVPGFVTGPAKAVHSVTSTISGAVGDALSKIPGVEQLSSWFGGLISPLVDYVMKAVIATPFTENMNGARTYDMTYAGADVVLNDQCQQNSGCKTDAKEAYKVREQYLAEQQAHFEAKPLFARMFDTDSSYSLISRLAVSMPGSMSGATAGGAASILTSPVSKLSTVFSSAFSKQTASASSLGVVDPFGVPQRVFPEDEIPKDPEGFWDANCVNGPLAKSTPGSVNIDASEWLNDPANVTQDENTGTAIFKNVNPCMLLKDTIQNVGALYGIPQDPDSSTPSTPTVPTTGSDQNGQCIQLDGVDGLNASNQFTDVTAIIPKVTNVVIHWIDSNPESPEEVHSALASSGTSVQFYVSQSGKIMQLTQCANNKAGHAKNANDFAIGIEIGSPNAESIGDTAPYHQLEDALMNNTTQKAQVIKLATALAKKFGITNVTVGNQVLYTSGDTCAALGLSFPGTCATQAEASQFGIVGHYQLQNTKSDPGPTYVTQIQQGVKSGLGR